MRCEDDQAAFTPPAFVFMKAPGFLLAILALYALHQDFWFWKSARPLLFGFLPVGLAYHAAYCLACTLLLWRLSVRAWPQHLEDEAEAARDHRQNQP
jgi:hypothetical protein